MAPTLSHRGDRVSTTDDVIGVPALARKHPGWPVPPGQGDRRAVALQYVAYAVSEQATRRRP